MWLARVPRPRAPLYTFHQTLWSYLPRQYTQPGAPRPFVFRDFGNHLLMLSRYRPQCDTRCIAPEIKTGQVYQFEVRCSPVRGTYRSDDGTRRKRRNPYRTSDERRAWLDRKLDGAATVRFASVFDRPNLCLTAADGRRIHWPECEIRGAMEVTDRTALICRMCQGIGGRGAWGHGLLWLPEVMA